MLKLRRNFHVCCKLPTFSRLNSCAHFATLSKEITWKMQQTGDSLSLARRKAFFHHRSYMFRESVASETWAIAEVLRHLRAILLERDCSRNASWKNIFLRRSETFWQFILEHTLCTFNTIRDAFSFRVLRNFWSFKKRLWNVFCS